MKIISFDQSSRITGYAVLEDKKLLGYGKFTLTDEDFGDRLNRFRKQVKKLITEEQSVDKVLFEEIQLQQNVDTFKKLAMVYGVMMELLVELNIPYDIVSSNTWKSKCKIKKTVRETEKQAAQRYVLDNFGKKVTQDEADAICLGYTYFNIPQDFDWSK
jgi:Holliday junction resolvasome RuvABC endonuclease subunit